MWHPSLLHRAVSVLGGVFVVNTGAQPILEAPFTQINNVAPVKDDELRMFFRATLE